MVLFIWVVVIGDWFSNWFFRAREVELLLFKFNVFIVFNCCKIWVNFFKLVLVFFIWLWLVIRIMLLFLFMAIVLWEACCCWKVLEKFFFVVLSIMCFWLINKGFVFMLLGKVLKVFGVDCLLMLRVVFIVRILVGIWLFWLMIK